MRTCSKCLTTYQDVPNNFYLSTRDGYLKVCKACKKLKHQEYKVIRSSGYKKVSKKTCLKCGVTYTDIINNFHINRNNVDGYHGTCKLCRCSTEQVRRNGEKRQKILENKRADWERNREKNSERRRLHYKLNKERLCQEKSIWKRTHSDVVNAVNARRRASQRLATPKWADKKACRAFYKKAKELTQKTGIKYVVDHIDPLTSDLVCGLHCENNLQVISAFDNTLKSNHFVPYRVDADGEKHFLFNPSN